MTRNISKIAGFTAAAVKGGIRGKDRLDIGMIFADKPAVTVGVFTTNLVKAAPVLLAIERLQSGKCQAVVVNSGIANACTGEQGIQAAKETARLAAEKLGIDPELVLVSSTGVIGEQLDMSCFEKSMAVLVENLSEDGFTDFSRAIMTTDTVPKTAIATCGLNGAAVTLYGVAKGSGMIKPNMATMLAFVMTDAVLPVDLMQEMLGTEADTTFNAITVDGDTSTNDTVLLMASGAAGNPPVGKGSEAAENFRKALHDVLNDLALQIVKDGEGATKFITLRVKNAQTRDEARKAADTVAESKLVKTAFFGEDANWGRIIGALGRSGARFDPNKVDISFDNVMMVKDGLGKGKDAEEKASQILKQNEFIVTIDLKAGNHSFEYYTCDLSIDYVKINADYRT